MFVFFCFFLQRVTDKCFKKCISRPGNSLDNSEQVCKPCPCLKLKYNIFPFHTPLCQVIFSIVCSCSWLIVDTVYVYVSVHWLSPNCNRSLVFLLRILKTVNSRFEVSCRYNLQPLLFSPLRNVSPCVWIDIWIPGTQSLKPITPDYRRKDLTCEAPSPRLLHSFPPHTCSWVCGGNTAVYLSHNGHERWTSASRPRSFVIVPQRGAKRARGLQP